MKHIQAFFVNKARAPYIAAFLTAVLLGAGCSNPIATPDQVSAAGTVLLRLGDGTPRTLTPGGSRPLSYRVTASNGSSSLTVAETWNGAGDRSIELAQGIWTVTVTGFVMENGQGVDISQGSGTISVNPGGNPGILVIQVEPLLGAEGGGTGILSYTLSAGGSEGIRYPPAVTLTGGTLTLEGVSVSYGPEERDLTLPQGSGEIRLLPAGYYCLTVRLTSAQGGAAARSEIVHIYKNRVTKIEDAPGFAFTADELTWLAGTVRIIGAALVGETLTADASGLGGTGAVSYQWNRAASPGAAGEAVPGETGETYVLSPADLEKYITVTVTRAGYAGCAASPATSQVMDAVPAPETWTVAAPFSSSGVARMNKIIYGGGKFVAAGEARQLGYSEDGIEWTLADIREFFEINEHIISVAYGGPPGAEKFVATANGKIIYSADGETWSLADTAGLPSNALSNAGPIIFSAGKFISVNGGGRIIWSEDGLHWNWIPQGTGEGQSGFEPGTGLKTLSYGGGKFIGAASSTGTLAYSQDGLRWTMVSRTQTGVGTRVIYDVGYFNGKFIMLSGLGISYSDDGETWTAAAPAPFLNMASITVGGGLIVIGGVSQIAYSRDGESWTTVSQILIGSNFRSIAFGQGKFVGIGSYNGMIAYTSW
jgi:hypothetical protein